VALVRIMGAGVAHAGSGTGAAEADGLMLVSTGQAISIICRGIELRVLSASVVETTGY
jgi:hypothetical protein